MLCPQNDSPNVETIWTNQTCKDHCNDLVDRSAYQNIQNTFVPISPMAYISFTCVIPIKLRLSEWTRLDGICTTLLVHEMYLKTGLNLHHELKTFEISTTCRQEIWIFLNLKSGGTVNVEWRIEQEVMKAYIDEEGRLNTIILQRQSVTETLTNRTSGHALRISL